MAEIKPTLVVHIGAMKTGTSAVQSALSQLSADLLERSVSYPNLTGAGFGWQAERGLSNGNGVIPQGDETAWRDLLQRCAASMPTDLQIISYEGLVWEAGKEVFWQDLADHGAATGREVVVVIYMRDPFRYLFSAYSQAVKTDWCQNTFEQWLNGPTLDRQFGVYKNLDLMAALAQRHGCEFRAYRYEEAKPSVAEHFLATACRVPIQGLNIPDPVMNASLSTFDLSFHRGVNSRSGHLGRLLGWERMDSTRQKQSPSRHDPGRHELSAAGQARLVELVGEYREMLQRCTDFADRVDYSIDYTRLTERFTPEEARMHDQCFSLGRFVAGSYVDGYIKWDLTSAQQ